MGEDDTKKESPEQESPGLLLPDLDLPEVKTSSKSITSESFTVESLQEAELPVPQETDSTPENDGVRDRTELVGSAGQKFETLLDLSLEKIGDILQYQTVPGSEEEVDIIKTQATLAASVVSASIRIRDGHLQRRMDNKLNLILEELKALQPQFGVTLAGPETGQLPAPPGQDSLSAPVPVFARRN